MSPEQAKGAPATTASDQYALALTLIEALTGAQVFAPRQGETETELRRRVAGSAPPDLLPELHPALAAWFRRALAASPRERFPDATTMGATLSEALAHHVS